MQRLRFPLAVLATSVALVFGLVLTGGLLVGNALAGGPLWLGGAARVPKSLGVGQSPIPK